MKCFEYLQFENLFWSILLPEWVIGICQKEFSHTKEEIIRKIMQDEEDSMNANDSFYDDI